MLIFLIGYMGSGKSTTGQLLAEKTGMEFIDLDNVITQQTGCTINSFITEKGEEAFRETEHECLKQLLHKKNSLIALGGGTPCFYNNMNLIHQYGFSIYLKLSADTLYERLVNNREHRPLIKDKTEKELKQFIRENLAVREPFYLKATYKVKAKDLDIVALADFLKNEQPATA